MTHTIAAAALDRLAATLPDASPVHMLNLLRLRPDGGREIYFGRSIPAFRAIAAALRIEDIEPIWTGTVAGTVAGPENGARDTVPIVRYPSLEAFRAVVDGDRYRTEAVPHRLAAVLDWRLIAQTQMPRPG